MQQSVLLTTTTTTTTSHTKPNPTHHKSQHRGYYELVDRHATPSHAMIATPCTPYHTANKFPHSKQPVRTGRRVGDSVDVTWAREIFSRSTRPFCHYHLLVYYPLNSYFLPLRLIPKKIALFLTRLICPETQNLSSELLLLVLPSFLPSSCMMMIGERRASLHLPLPRMACFVCVEWDWSKY